MASSAAQMEAKARQEMTQQQLQEMKGGGGKEGTGNIGETTGISASSDTGQPDSMAPNQTAPVSPTPSPAGGTGKFVSSASGDAGALFDLLA
ncbi:MAG TPA: hypothetical protein EYG11_02475 [Candidatus Latescibacteria bacterium]|nr:hypothetical protein [Candidatus Latescibacterota bacterium]